MTMMRKILVGGAGLAAIAAAATPAAAQYYPYGHSQPYSYGYASQYGYANPYAYQSSQVAAQQCTAAVQQRLANRAGIGGIIGAVLGANTSGRVLSVTSVQPRRSGVRVTGLATSGRFAGYGPYGMGAYGAVGYGYQPDLRFACSVDYRGYIRAVDINRR